MNILCLGCSWTAGVSMAGNYNWVDALATLAPDHTYYNLAQGGSSLLHSIWVMEHFLKNSGVKIDKIIFQITNEGRVTYYRNLDNFNINEWLVQTAPNIYRLHIKWDRIRAVTYSIASIKPTNPVEEEIFKFAGMYYSSLTPEHQFNLEHRILIEYLKSKVDLLFFHQQGHYSHFWSIVYTRYDG